MSCSCDTHTTALMPYSDALSLLLDTALPITEAESISLAQALDRVLAENITSSINVPPADNSGMDGYAFRNEDTKHFASLVIQDTVFAGDHLSTPVKEGHCVRIMTGAHVPEDVDTVVMQERTRVEDGRLFIDGECKTGDNIRKAGEDISKGDVILKKGRKLTPSDLGLISSVGINQVKVIRKLKVAVISTGDELKPAGTALEPGQIYESNGIVISSLLKRMNIDVIEFGIIPDIPEEIERAFIQANQQADVVISSGGVSVGDADYVKPLLQKLGHIDFWKVAIKPGKPFAFGKLSESYFIGLPGNPVSATVTFDVLAKPFLQKLSGMHASPTLSIPATTASTFRKRPGRMDFQRAVLHQTVDGSLQVSPTGNQGSGILTSVSLANGYVVIPAEQGSISEGETVHFTPLSTALRESD
ncbi:gephyrin-like molybdotransferase Glp [Teredinibacter sp. KSP-S5-2]|uniref:molybdopterin molybdotransferase MoeA n=1 Tax=Teredinibacter sp. KSP-S5-2 TaxID=3034506 RepID=UPI002934858A|nr:gephyrin-like molybdotransferase Glp [Teredinibacter sp. KSP-S5-2]WNO10730.1 molybdopterin molybdotransferase MoeA [Teredinibacter sp. KSP-S5-2]